MKEDVYEELIFQSFNRRMSIHVKKNHDYANPEEVLGNFKRVAKVLDGFGLVPGCTPDTVALIYVVLKIDRFCNLTLKGKKPKNESVQDTIDDLKNYCDLMEGCWVDRQDGKKNGNKSN